jgi:hypothetical protein
MSLCQPEDNPAIESRHVDGKKLIATLNFIELWWKHNGVDITEIINGSSLSWFAHFLALDFTCWQTETCVDFGKTSCRINSFGVSLACVSVMFDVIQEGAVYLCWGRGVVGLYVVLRDVSGLNNSCWERLACGTAEQQLCVQRRWICADFILFQGCTASGRQFDALYLWICCMWLASSA